MVRPRVRGAGGTSAGARSRAAAQPAMTASTAATASTGSGPPRGRCSAKVGRVEASTTAIDKRGTRSTTSPATSSGASGTHSAR